MTLTCDCCGQRIRIGQEQLTRSEKNRFDWSGDPHGSPNIIEAQAVKAIANFYEVSDWTSYWDPELSIGENAEIMQREGGEQTMREMRSRYETGLGY